MSNERTYGEDEVSEIFALATGADGASLPAVADQEGLTLEALKEVGREVGLSPERVAAAAATIDTRSEPLARRTVLGAPVSVGRVVELPRAATEREWQILVAELRETFGAKGRVTSQGDMREWTNGNLHVYLEPTEAGHRLRLGTRKFGAGAVTAIGTVGVLMGVFLLAVVGVAGGGTFRATLSALIPTLLALSGGGVLARNFIRLRRWAGEREGQMEHIAGRARALLEAPPRENEPNA